MRALRKSDFGLRSWRCRAATRDVHVGWRPVGRRSPAVDPGFRSWLAIAICLAPFAFAGCGYTLGSPYRAELRTVYVPTFTSNSNRRWLEYQLTESVQKQIQSRTPFLLASEAEADTKLTGKIVDGTKRVLGQTSNSDPRELQMNLMVEVTWEDARTGKILKQQQIPIAPEALQLAAQSEFAPEVGQSMASGTREVVDRLARNIVDMMEAPWR